MLPSPSSAVHGDASIAKAPPVVLLMGPTASGKTGLALDLAERLPVEIISVDSAQVYRDMDIGTAKPDLATRARVPHHLIDVLDPAEAYSAARFADDALRLIADIRARGRIPLLVGGTMLYFRTLTVGLNDLPAADASLRAAIEADAQVLGWRALHARLAEIDPETAARLHPNDQQRIQRALEIASLSGQAPSAFFSQPRSRSAAYAWVRLALNPPQRADLHARIALRFAQMMEQGLLEEVRRLHARGDLHPALPSIRAVGYRQLWAHLDGEVSQAEAIDKAVAATRQLAKRQLTWLRSDPAVEWLDPARPDLLDLAMERMGADAVRAFK